MTPEEELARAQECQQLLGNRYVKEALGSIREALVDQWQRTPVKDSDLREKIWAIYCASVKFEEILRSHIETGKMAAVTIDARRTPNWASRIAEQFGYSETR